jgi:tetratricopeptide (TPR) repeat protein
MRKALSRPLGNSKWLGLRRSLAALLFVAAVLTPASFALALQSGSSTAGDPAAPFIKKGIGLLGSDPAAAKLQFTAALKANPQSADAFTWRGIAENQLRQFQAAQGDFQAALRLDPASLPAHYNLALSLIRTGQSAPAIEQLRFVVKAQPGVPESEYNLALLLEQTHATAEAAEHLQAAYKARPDDLAILQHLIIDLLATGHEDEARPMLQRVADMPVTGARRQVAGALLEAGDDREAIALLEALHAQPDSSHETVMLLARAYISAKEDSKAIEILKPADPIDATGESAYLLGLAYSEIGAVDEAYHAFASAIAKNPRNSRALYHLAMLESKDPQQLPAAVLHLRAAVRLEPANAAYNLELGKVLLQQNAAREALAVLQRVPDEGPSAGQRDLLLGIAQIIVGGPRAALPTLERAVAEDPSLALSHNVLGFCLLSQGDPAKAAAAYAKASDLEPASRTFAHAAAAAYDRSNDASQAMVYAGRAAALPEARAEDHLLVGKLLAKQGQPQEAIRALNEAIALDPELEEAYFLLGRVYMQAGDADQAFSSQAIAKSSRQDRPQEATHKGTTHRPAFERG